MMKQRDAKTYVPPVVNYIGQAALLVRSGGSNNLDGGGTRNKSGNTTSTTCRLEKDVKESR